jgi:hypothetical protein
MKEGSTRKKGREGEEEERVRAFIEQHIQLK